MKTMLRSPWIFRIGILFIVILVAGFFLNRNLKGVTGTEKPPGIVVEVQPVRSIQFENALKVTGVVSAEVTAGVTARIPGVLDEVFVEEGDRVETGSTVLFLTDALKVDKAKEIAEKQFGVSECAVREKEAFREQVRADFEKAQLDFDRYQRLFEEDHAVSANTFELQESRFKQASAAMKHADALVELSRQQLDQARSNLAIANKEASDSRVKAPISGLVFKRHKEPGEMAEMGKPIIEIYDDSAMEISAFLPQELYTRVIPGETHVQVRAGGIDMGELSVSFKSPSIDLRLRNFELKTRIAPPPAGVVPGALAEIKVILDRREGLGVPTRCIQNRAGSTVVFIAEDETARMVPVSLGFETGGYTEVSGEGIFEGVSVVTMGQNLLDDRDSVIPHEKESQ